MTRRFAFLATLALALLTLPQPGLAKRAPIPTISQYPYLGAITVDASTGKVLFEKNADAACFPASVVKLMDLLLILEDVARGSVSLTNIISTTAEASTMGGTQVYLKEHESFTVDDLLYALMVQSANDAAVALAIGIAGSKDAFVARMNARAKELGMQATTFHSVHGLPPAAGQKPDVSTARDLSLLARELLKHQDTLRYTSTVKRGFRQDTYVMENHNHLLGQGGCDGMKTGYIKAGGYSIVATAARGDKRVIAAVVSSRGDKTPIDMGKARDAATAQLLAEGLAAAAALPPPAPPAVTNAPPVEEEVTPAAKEKSGWGWKTITGIVIGVALILFGMYRRRLDSNL